MRRYLELAVSFFAYGLFGATWVAFIAFVGGWPLPFSVDAGPAAPLGEALAIDLACLTLFCGHHSVFPRAGAKRLVAGVVGPALERSTYVLGSSLALGGVMALWRPLPQVVWAVDGPARTALLGLFWAGVLLTLAASHLLDGLHLFGVRQALAAFRRRAAPELAFRTPGPYRLVRHPMMTGLLLTLWAAPTMSQGRLLLAACFSAYIVGAVRWLEEPALERSLGDAYRRYRAEVPMLVPGPGGWRKLPKPRPARPSPEDGPAAPWGT